MSRRTVGITSLTLSLAILTKPDTFPSVADSTDWQYVRTTTNFQSNGPVTDVTSEQIRCYERNPGTGAPGTYSVQAGQTLNYNAKASISHPGPMAFYIAQVPSGQKAATWDGKGAVWSKIYQEMPKFGGSMTWSSSGMALTLNVPLNVPPTNILQAPSPSASPSPAVCRTASTCSAPSTSLSTAPAAPEVLSFTFRAPSCLVGLFLLFLPLHGS